MKFWLICILIAVFGCILFCGCVNTDNNKENSIATTSTTTAKINENTSTPKLTIDEQKWEDIVDNTYVLTATGGNLNKILIPISPNTGYRMKIIGEKRLTIRIYPNDKDLVDSKGKLIVYNAKTNVIAAGVSSYNGIFKTDSYQKNLEIEWVYFSNEPNVVGTSQNVNVKLERYTGDSSVIPDTTNAPEPYRIYDGPTIIPTITTVQTMIREY